MRKWQKTEKNGPKQRSLFANAQPNMLVPLLYCRIPTIKRGIGDYSQTARENAGAGAGAWLDLAGELFSPP